MKLNLSNKTTRRSCENILKRYFNQCKVITSSASPITADAIYQPGGTTTIVGDPYVGRIGKTSSDDRLG
jgi:hypothetical protein